MRRCTRLSNGINRKACNHGLAVALHYFAHNFIKIQRTLPITPEMAAGAMNRLCVEVKREMEFRCLSNGVPALFGLLV